jgi:hypothetical protein
MTDRTTRDADFRQFAGGFGDALARLAVLLVDDETVARRLVVRALALLRRRWSSLENSGAPEAQAVDALISRLPRSVSTSAVQEVGLDDDADVVLQRQQAVLRSWTTLTPRERASLLFVDASVASPRLAGMAMPPALGSVTRVEGLEDAAWASLLAGMRADPVAADWPFDDDELGAALAESLRAKALSLRSYAPAPAEIERQRRTDLNRGVLAAATAVVLVVVVAVAVVHVSTASNRTASDQTVSSDAVTSASAIAPPQFTIVTPPTPTPAPPDAIGSPGSTVTLGALGEVVPAASPTPGDDGLVVDWPTRGTLAGNANLAADLRATFAAAHSGLTGPVQVLLITDTTTFRVAYVTARTQTGSIGSWFYGNIGSQHLTEGSSSLGFSIVGADAVVSAVLVYGGSRELVALASPKATSMVLRGGPEPVGFLTQQGFGVLDVTQFEENGLQVDVKAADGSSADVLPQEVDLDLATPRAGGITTAGYPIVRGYPDPGLLIDADQVATIWQTSDLHRVGVPDVLWGGTDGKIQQVVVRLRTVGGIDVVVVAWSGPEAKADAELLAPNAADFPITWDYPTGTGTRVGVLAPIGVSTVQLIVDGAPASAPVAVDANGYASLVEPPYSGTVTGHTVAVAMLNSGGKSVSSLSVPPPA